MKYKMISVAQFWQDWHKGKYRDESKTLVLMDDGGELVQEFAFVMNGFFDHFRQGGNFRCPIKFVLVKS